jgi:hypothetical protein
MNQMHEDLRETLAEVRLMDHNELLNLRAAVLEHDGTGGQMGVFVAAVVAAIDKRFASDRVREQFRPTFEEIVPADVDIDGWFDNFVAMGRAARVLGSDINVAELFDAAVEVTRAANPPAT